MSTYLIRDVKILDGTGRAPFAGSVLVEGDRIAAVTEGSGPSTVGEAAVIDGAGATLMPGLIESHAHLGLADLGSSDLTRVPPEEHMLITVPQRAHHARRRLHQRVLGGIAQATPGCGAEA